MTSILIISAFILGTWFGVVAGVSILAIAKAAKDDPRTVRAENEQDRRMW